MENRRKKNYRRIIKENPFITSDAVLGEDFFGRKEEINQVMEFLRKRKEYNLLIHGQRRIGKTSLLLKIKELVKASQIGKATYMDLQNKARLDISDVLLELASQIDSDIEAHIDFNKNDFLAHHVAGYFKNTFLPRVFEKLPPNRSLILLFDEFDSIGEPEGVKNSPKITNIAYHKFIPFLTDIKKKEFPLKFIFAVGRNYKDLDDNHYGQITKTGNQVELSYFNKEDLETLINSSDDILPFERGAIERIYALTCGQPFFSQCLASSAFDYANKQKKKSITPGMIDDQIESAIKKHGGGFHWLWGGFLPDEKIILYLMARLKEDYQIINYKNINEMAARLVLLPAVYALDKILEKLITFKIIRVVREKQVHYDFYVEFFRKWIVVENRLDKIRMLLNKLDIETENFLMNGKFYYMKKDYNSAEEYFLKVIEKFPSHYEALYYLGLISTNLIEKNIKNLDSAFDWFSRAFRLNPYGTKDEYLDILNKKLILLEDKENEAENIEIENILKEIQRINPADSRITEKLVEIYIIRNKKISDIGNLTEVKAINLKNKGLKFLPNEINLLKNLRKLDLRNNKIIKLPIQITQLKNIEELLLEGNPINIPGDIAASSAEEILRYIAKSTVDEPIKEPTIFVACRWDEESRDANDHIKGLIKKAGMRVSEGMEKTGVISLALKETINIMDAQGFCVILFPGGREIAPTEVMHEISTARNFQIPAFMFVEQTETGRPEIAGRLRSYQADLNSPGEWFEFRKSELLSGKDDDRILRWLKEVKRFIISEYAKMQPRIESAIAAQWTQLSDMQPFHAGLLEISEAYDQVPGMLYNAAARAAANITGAEFGFIGILIPRKEWMDIEIKGLYAESKSIEEKIHNALNYLKLGYNYEGETFGLVGYAAKMGIPVCEGYIERDMEKLREEGKNIIFPGNINVQSELCVPIKLKGRTIGVIEVASRFENQFQKVHRMVLDWLSKVLAIAYSGEQLGAAISDLSKPSTNKRELANRILNTLMKWSQADSGYIALLRGNHWSVETIAGSGVKAEIKELFDKGNLEIKPNKGLAGKVLSSGKAIYSEETERAVGYLKWFNPVSSEIVLPIITKNGNTIGVVDLEFTSPQNFKNIDKKLYEDIANLLAVFFDNEI